MGNTTSTTGISGTSPASSSLPESENSVPECQCDTHLELDVRPGHQTDSESGWETDDEGESYHGSEDDWSIARDDGWPTDTIEEDWDSDTLFWGAGLDSDGDDDFEVAGGIDSEMVGGIDSETGSSTDSQDGWDTVSDSTDGTDLENRDGEPPINRNPQGPMHVLVVTATLYDVDEHVEVGEITLTMCPHLARRILARVVTVLEALGFR